MDAFDHQSTVNSQQSTMIRSATGIDITESVRDRMGALIPGFYENKRFSNEKYMKKPGFWAQRAQVIRSYNYHKCKRLLSGDRIYILMYFHWCRVRSSQLT